MRAKAFSDWMPHVNRTIGAPGRTRQQRLVVLGLFLAVIFLAARAAGMSSLLDFITDPLTLVFPAAAAGLLLLRWPGLGLLALVVVTLLVPFSIGTGTQASINISILLVILLLGVWIFDGVASRRPGWLRLSRPAVPFLVLSLLATVSFLVGQLPWFPFSTRASFAAQIGGLAVFWVAAAAYILAGSLIRSVGWLKAIVWLFLGLSAVYIFAQLVPPLRSLSDQVFQQGVFSSSLFYLWITALAFSQAVFNPRLGWFWRGGLMVLVLATLFVGLVLNSGWTSGWMPAAAAIAAILVLSRSRWSFLAAVIAAVSLVLKADSIQRLLYAGDNPYSLMTRVEAWRIIGNLVKVNPLLGLGPANYYWYTPLYPILGYRVNFNSHNNYVDLVAQVGVLGLLAFVWLAVEIGLMGWRLVARVPEGFPRAYVIGALGGLAGMLVAGMLGDWFLPFIYNVGLSGFRASILGWIFLGALAVFENEADPGAEAVSTGGSQP